MEKNTVKLLTAATGCLATLKFPELVKSLLQTNSNKNYVFEITVIVTEYSKRFFNIADIPSHVKLYDDQAEWKSWTGRGDPVLHIELCKWADMMVIAPLDAHTLGKMNQGICDNLLTCTTRAWNFSKPLFFCPSMNTKMWEHPVTTKQVSVLECWGHTHIPPIYKKPFGTGVMADIQTVISTLESWGHTHIPPISKTDQLMCEAGGVGAMAELDTIVLTLHNAAEQMLDRKC